jgi:capsid portal protein
MKEKEEAKNQQMQQKNHLIDAMNNEVDIYKKGMAHMKQQLSTQAEVFKNKKQQILQDIDALKLERDALVEERDALKEEKMKLEYAMYDLIHAGDVNKDKMKKIQEKSSRSECFGVFPDIEMLWFSCMAVAV